MANFPPLNLFDFVARHESVVGTSRVCAALQRSRGDWGQSELKRWTVVPLRTTRLDITAAR